jgi:hypothetical protein
MRSKFQAVTELFERGSGSLLENWKTDRYDKGKVVTVL